MRFDVKAEGGDGLDEPQITDGEEQQGIDLVLCAGEGSPRETTKYIPVGNAQMKAILKTVWMMGRNMRAGMVRINLVASSRNSLGKDGGMVNILGREERAQVSALPRACSEPASRARR